MVHYVLRCTCHNCGYYLGLGRMSIDPTEARIFGSYKEADDFRDYVDGLKLEPYPLIQAVLDFGSRPEQRELFRMPVKPVAVIAQDWFDDQPGDP